MSFCQLPLGGPLNACLDVYSHSGLPVCVYAHIDTFPLQCHSYILSLSLSCWATWWSLPKSVLRRRVLVKVTGSSSTMDLMEASLSTTSTSTSWEDAGWSGPPAKQTPPCTDHSTINVLTVVSDLGYNCSVKWNKPHKIHTNCNKVQFATTRRVVFFFRHV